MRDCVVTSVFPTTKVFHTHIVSWTAVQESSSQHDLDCYFQNSVTFSHKIIYIF
jgi:hypothetical protein